MMILFIGNADVSTTATLESEYSRRQQQGYDCSILRLLSMYYILYITRTQEKKKINIIMVGVLLELLQASNSRRCQHLQHNKRATIIFTWYNSQDICSNDW
jgi:hypothetical protein